MKLRQILKISQFVSAGGFNPGAVYMFIHIFYNQEALAFWKFLNVLLPATYLTLLYIHSNISNIKLNDNILIYDNIYYKYI